MKSKNILYVVIPCYNEEAVLNETTKRLSIKMSKLIDDKIISNKSKIMYVNDGSKDKTWEMIKNISKKEEHFTGICLSRNRGHQNALLAGLMCSKKYADIVISMDADLQDDINAIDAMLDKYYDGAEIVYGVRSARKKDTFFKKITAEGFYKFMKKMGVDIVFNHADYRLTSKRVLEELEKYGEVNLFLRGIFPLIGFKTEIVYYERNERFAGESKYPLKKMLNFAWDGITSFSIKPIRLLLSFGIVVMILSSIALVTLGILSLCNIDYNSLLLIISIMFFLFGVIEISLGIVGEYIGKIYSETKKRPRYVIANNLEEE